MDKVHLSYLLYGAVMAAVFYGVNALFKIDGERRAAPEIDRFEGWCSERNAKPAEGRTFFHYWAPFALQFSEGKVFFDDESVFETQNEVAYLKIIGQCRLKNKHFREKRFVDFGSSGVPSWVEQDPE